MSERGDEFVQEPSRYQKPEDDTDHALVIHRMPSDAKLTSVCSWCPSCVAMTYHTWRDGCVTCKEGKDV